jgi:hypothetical protein
VAAPFTLCFPFGIVLCIRKARTPRHPLLFTHQVCSVQSDKGWILGVRMLVKTSYCSRRTFFRKFAGRNFDLEYLPRLACEPLYSDSPVESSHTGRNRKHVLSPTRPHRQLRST